MFIFGIIIALIGVIIMIRSILLNVIWTFITIMGLLFVISGIVFMSISVDNHQVKMYLARNLEDNQLDTIYTYQNNTTHYEWVNMDSLWIDNNDPYATKYFIIKKLK